MSQDHNHLNHATWECKYHVVFTPRYRKKAPFGQVRRYLSSVFHALDRRKECRIEEQGYRMWPTMDLTKASDHPDRLRLGAMDILLPHEPTVESGSPKKKDLSFKCDSLGSRRGT